MLTKKAGEAVPLKVFSRGGKATLKRYGKGLFSLIAQLRHAKNPKQAAALRRQIGHVLSLRKKEVPTKIKVISKSVERRVAITKKGK